MEGAKASSKAISTAFVQGIPEDEGWQQVRRRKSYPAHWRTASPSIPAAKPYIPYHQPSYAQVVRKPKPTMSLPAANKPSTPPSMTKPQPNSTVYYVSPHSPSRLRFPPSHTFSEWKGRCFRCCRTGHSASKCRNPKRCGRCWSYGHIGTACKQDMVAPPPPIRTTPLPTVKYTEPSFEELLSGSYPYRAPEMPSDRPLNLHVFLERDHDYFEELNRLRQGVVMYTLGCQWDLTTDNVVSIACRTNKVSQEEIKVSQMSGSRFLIILPDGLHPDTFINATPQDLWDDGITFQPWSPLDDASISIPAFKVLLRLVGLPPTLQREHFVKQAIARFGVFLGTVEPGNPSSIASWLIEIGVDDLSLIPTQLVLHIGGLMYYIQVYVEVYQRSPLYTSDDMPKHPKVYRRPIPPPPSSSSSDDDMLLDNNELIPMSTRVLREVCRGRTAESLPPELKRFAAMAEVDTGLSTQHLGTEHPNAKNQQQIKIHQIQHSNPKIRQSKEITTLIEIPSKNNEPVDLICSLGETGQSSFSDSAQEGQRRIVPQRILLRGDSSSLIPDNTISSPTKKISLTNNSHPSISNTTANQISSGQEPLLPRLSKKTYLPPLPPIPTPRLKGIPVGPLKGPFSSKYKWTRPKHGITKQIPISTSSQVIKKSKETERPKPKIKEIRSATESTSRRATGKQKVSAQAQFALNPEGFYDVEVQYEHVAKLASACGFKNKDVEEMIALDNAQRKVQPSTVNTVSEKLMEDDSEIDINRFDPDPEDELSSEEEA